MTSQLFTSPDFLLHQDRHHQDHQYDNLPDQCHRHCTSDINLWCIHTCLVPRGLSKSNPGHTLLGAQVTELPAMRCGCTVLRHCPPFCIQLTISYILYTLYTMYTYMYCILSCTALCCAGLYCFLYGTDIHSNARNLAVK